MMFKQVEYSLKREFIGKGKLIFLEIKKNNPRQPLTMPTGMMQPVQPPFARTKKWNRLPWSSVPFLIGIRQGFVSEGNSQRLLQFCYSVQCSIFPSMIVVRQDVRFSNGMPSKIATSASLPASNEPTWSSNPSSRAGRIVTDSSAVSKLSP